MNAETVGILVVEDNPVDAIWVKRQLTRIGTSRYEITHVESLAEAAQSRTKSSST